MIRVALWLALATCLAILLFTRWPTGQWLATDFQQLLPRHADDSWRQLANDKASAAYSGQLVLMARGEGASEFLQQAVSRLQDAGFADPDFELRQANLWRELAGKLHTYSAGLATPTDREKLATNPQGYLEQFRKLLYSPLGGSQLNSLATDPLGLFHNFLFTNIPATANRHEDYQLTYVQVPESQRGFDTIGKLYEQYVDLKRQALDRGLSFHALGNPLYTAYGVQSGQHEISTIGVVSLSALVLLLWIFLRTGAGLALTLLAVASGIAGGLALTLALFREIHLLAMVFGATLVGIAADYALHYLSHSLLPDWTPDSALRRVMKGLALGVLSSSIGFGVLILMPFPGLQQIGVFMAGGLLCTFATVSLLFPAWFRSSSSGRHLPAFFQQRAAGIKIQAWVLVVAVTLITVPGLLLLRPADQVRDFYAAPSNLQADQALITSRMPGDEDSSFILLKSANQESLLRLEEHIVSAVPGLKPGITALIPSQHSQSRTNALLRELFLDGTTPEYLHTLGFSDNYVQEYGARLMSQHRPITPTDLAGLTLPVAGGDYLGCEEDGCASWLALTGNEDRPALEKILRENSAAALVQPVADINALLSRYREQTTTMLLVSGLAITLALCPVLGWRAALRVMSLPVSACFLSLSAAGYLQGNYNIVNILALFLVAGVSLDFAIFREITPRGDLGATRLAIMLSALTSILAFGMLAFSETPVISDFGRSLGLGLLIAWLLSWLHPTNSIKQPQASPA